MAAHSLNVKTFIHEQNSIAGKANLTLSNYVDLIGVSFKSSINEFPKEINKANYYDLLKIPGIGPTSAKKIISSRKFYTLEMKDLQKMGISLKRAKYFILCNGKYFANKKVFQKEFLINNLILEEEKKENNTNHQLSLWGKNENLSV